MDDNTLFHVLDEEDYQAHKEAAFRPTVEEIIEWEREGIMQATDGCQVEPDGTCPHGCKSWLIVLGHI